MRSNRSSRITGQCMTKNAERPQNKANPEYLEALLAYIKIVRHTGTGPFAQPRFSEMRSQIKTVIGTRLAQGAAQDWRAQFSPGAFLARGSHKVRHKIYTHSAPTGTVKGEGAQESRHKVHPPPAQEPAQGLSRRSSRQSHFGKPPY